MLRRLSPCPWDDGSMQTRTHASVRRAVVAVTIVSFSVAALMGIAALLSSATFGDTASRVLLTTVIVGCASVVTLACLVPIDSRWAFVSIAGFSVTLATAAFALLMVWVNTDSWDESAFRALGVGVTLSLTVAQMCLLLGVSVRRPAVSPLVWATLVLATLLAGLVIALIVGWNASDAGGRVIGIVAILDVLGTLVAIALGIFGSDQRSLTVTFTPALTEMVRSRATATGRTPDDVVIEAVRAYLASDEAPGLVSDAGAGAEA
jgi:hypothetical protein